MRIVAGAVALACSLSLAPLAAASGSVEALLGRLGKRGAATRTLKVSFVQRKRLELFATEVVTRGHCFYRRPGQIRWQTAPPDASVVLLRKDRVEIRAPGQRPQRVPLARSPVLGRLVADLFVWLGVRGVAGIKDRYRVRPGGAESGLDRLTLEPRRRALARRLRRIQLWISRAGDVRRIEILEPSGDRTTIELSDAERNRPLPGGLF